MAKLFADAGGQAGGRGVVTSFCLFCLVCDGRRNVLTYGGPSPPLVRAAGERIAVICRDLDSSDATNEVSLSPRCERCVVQM